jgi:rhamnosyltransferase subunit B
MRIVLTTFGTLGDVNPLIAVALEMRRRGHVPVLAVPEIFRPKIEPLGLAFAKVGPTLNPDRYVACSAHEPASVSRYLSNLVH